jgi:hypothetical protein
MDIIFVYHKEGKIRCLNLKQARLENDTLINDGWVHTETLNPCVWIENIFNNPETTLVEVKSLSGSTVIN